MYCCLCKKDKDLDEFTSYQRSRKSGNQCSSCVKKRSKNHYRKNKSKYQVRGQQTYKDKKELIRDYVINYLFEHPCVDCGETDIRVLEFDHLNKEDKIGCVSSFIYVSRSLELTKLEIAKCEVVCANCHSKRTAERKNSYRHQIYRGTRKDVCGVLIGLENREGFNKLWLGSTPPPSASILPFKEVNKQIWH